MSGERRVVSIVIAVRDGVGTIERALQSAFDQTHPYVEVIVIDGASTDGTRDVVERSADRLAYWVSEHDDGIGDAWNKGIAHSRGDVIVLLGADDELRRDFAASVVQALGPGALAVAYGDTVLLDATGRTVSQWYGTFEAEQLGRGFGFWHTSSAMTRAAFEAVGPFDTDTRIAVDTDWLLRAHARGIEFRRHGSLNYMRLGGVSTRRHRQGRREYADQLRRHGFAGVAPLRVSTSAAVVQAVGFGRWLRLRRQAALIAIAAFHAAYNLVPSWWLRKRLLRAWGVTIGDNSAIHSPVRFLSRGRVTIGARTLVNRDCVIDNRLSVTIGDDVSIAQGVRIFTLGHDVDDPYFASVGQSVDIQDRAVVFAGAMLMPGTRIGMGAVVLAGAVATGTVEPWTVVGGVPARRIRERSRDQRYRLEAPYHFQV
jgi:acetyltransferase-like isoleucine patch superfamily enzyme